MNRAQFMEQLKRLLSDISEAERQEALDYYESYFDDAGPENEADVIRELGSPGKVAAIIKADLHESNDRYAEYSELGYEDTRAREADQVPEKYTGAGKRKKAPHSEYEGTSGKTYDQARAEREARTRRRSGREYSAEREARTGRRSERGYRAEQKKGNPGLILLLIVLIFASPLITGAAGGLLGILVTILFLPFLIVFGLGAAVLGLVVGGLASVAAGIAQCVMQPAAGVLCIGIGCILVAVGALLLILLVWVAARVIPWLIRTVTNFLNNLLRRERKSGESA